MEEPREPTDQELRELYEIAKQSMDRLFDVLPSEILTDLVSDLEGLLDEITPPEETDPVEWKGEGF